MMKSTRFDIPELPTVSGHSNTVNGISYNDLAFDVQYLKDKMRKLEKGSDVNFGRKKSIAVAGDDETTVIDGTCSERCLKYFVDLVSITGLKEISRAKHPIVKGMWCITFLLSILLTTYYLYQAVGHYFEEPTATKVKIHRQPKYVYPDMLLCPDLWLDLPKALKSGATIGAIQYALGYLINYYFRKPGYFIEDYDQAKREFHAWYQSQNSNLIDLFKNISLDSRDFLHKCPNCEYLDFSKVLMDETVCFKIPMTYMTGKGTARSAIDILEVIVPDRTGGLLHKKKYWRLYVQPDLTIGTSTVRYVQVFPGHSNTIRFTPTHYVAIKQWNDTCVTNEERDLRNYSTVECALKCANLNKTCKQLGTLRQASVTSNLSEICHYYPQYYWLLYKSLSPHKKLVDQIPNACFDHCPPLCERWLYESSVESHEISSHKPVESGKDNRSQLEMTRIYLLNQAPLQGGYVVFKEVNTYSVDAMIGNIGGILGLWLGASIMSFIQIVVFLITWCFARHLNKKQERLRNFKNALITAGCTHPIRFENDMNTSYSSAITNESMA